MRRRGQVSVLSSMSTEGSRRQKDVCVRREGPLSAPPRLMPIDVTGELALVLPAFEPPLSPPSSLPPRPPRRPRRRTMTYPLQSPQNQAGVVDTVLPSLGGVVAWEYPLTVDQRQTSKNTSASLKDLHDESAGKTSVQGQEEHLCKQVDEQDKMRNALDEQVESNVEKAQPLPKEKSGESSRSADRVEEKLRIYDPSRYVLSSFKSVHEYDWRRYIPLNSSENNIERNNDDYKDEETVSQQPLRAPTEQIDSVCVKTNMGFHVAHDLDAECDARRGDVSDDDVCPPAPARSHAPAAEQRLFQGLLNSSPP